MQLRELLKGSESWRFGVMCAVSFEPSATDQQMRPGLIVQPADLDSRMAVSCVVDELTVTDEHAGVRDVIV